jgi:MFS family permease
MSVPTWMRRPSAGTTTAVKPDNGTYRSRVPARLDRLPWRRFHTRIVLALGVAWILDGLEIRIVSQMSTVIATQNALALTEIQTGYIASSYLCGEVVGALLFGRITDKFGRKKLFFFTLLLYLLANGIAGFSPNLWFLTFFRFLSGVGIGGEYTAVNSAIDELIPPYYRGRVDIAVNGTYWLGAMIGAAANMILLNGSIVPAHYAWRIGFLLGPLIALSVIWLRRLVPESPRWLMTHGRQEDAERIVDEIENKVHKEGIELDPIPESKALDITSQGSVSYRQIYKTMLHDYPKRSVLGLALMTSQALLYNAVFFTDGRVLIDFYQVPARDTSYYLIPFAAANLMGALILARWFDIIGRRKMITFTYCCSGVLVAIGASLFLGNQLNAFTQTLWWCVTFFFASAGASAAYLTVSEVFPLELRAQAISFFFAISLLIGGAPAPLAYTHLLSAGTHHLPLAAGYYAAAAFMIIGGLVAWRFAVDAERKSLEKISHPLTALPATIHPPPPIGT